MIIELGNHDGEKRVTTVNIPEFDKEHLDAQEHVPYDHKPITVAEFKTHRQDAIDYNQGTTRLPGNEAALAVVAAWPNHAKGRPAWVKCSDHQGMTKKGKSAALEAFLSEFYECPTIEDYYKGDLESAQVKKQLEYWTKQGAPGEFYGGPALPELVATYLVDGRIMSNNNDGGDTLLVAANSQGVGSAANTTTLTTTSTLVGTTALPGHRIVVYTLSGNVFVYGNIISNTAGTNGVITVDRWYTPVTPGGSAGGTPGTPWAWCVQDGGFVSTWFAGLATGANAAAATDHTLGTNGNAEIVTSGGGLIRKIAPTATDVSSSARTVTLVPVFTANGTDSLPATVTTVGWFASIVPGFGGAGGPMKFETVLNASATLAASGDQLTITETISGS